MRALLLFLTLACACVPGNAVAGGSSPSSCSPGRYCDDRLGITLLLPAGWRVVGTKQLAGSKQVAFAAGRSGQGYNLRLLVRAYAVTSFSSSRQSARRLAARLMHAEGVTVAWQTPVRYGGGFGLLIRDLPGGPSPALDAILARHQYVYQMILPGASLGADQRAALTSLQFIPIQGPFLRAHG